MKEFVFPANVIWVGECCYRVPVGRSGFPRRKYKDPSQKDDYTGLLFEGVKWQAHRLSYHLNVAPITCNPPNRKEGFILHTCDHKWCINPDHTYLGTAKQNAIDNAERNLAWRQKRSDIQKVIGFPEVSEAGRKRMAAANSKRMKGNPGPRKGIKHTEEAKAKMSASHIKRRSRS